MRRRIARGVIEGAQKRKKLRRTVMRKTVPKPAHPTALAGPVVGPIGAFDQAASGSEAVGGGASKIVNDLDVRSGRRRLPKTSQPQQLRGNCF